MNLTKIRTMVFDGDMSKEAIQYLLRCNGECEYLDYKIILDFTGDYHIASISKDILGMQNVGGGYIVVGVEDKTWKPVGIASSLNIDTKELRDKIRKATGLDLEVDIVEHTIYVENDNLLRFALILIRASPKLNKRRNPSICKKSFFPTEKWGITSGDIYSRKGDSTVKVTDGDELRDLIDNLDSRHEYQDINNAKESPSPFAVEHGLFRLLPPDYSAFIGREKMKAKILDAINLDPRIWIINLHGPGGVGKTALATHAAYHYFNHRDEPNAFESIMFLSAKERELNATDGIRSISPTLYSLENLFGNILHLFQHSEYLDRTLDKQRDTVIQILEAYRVLLVLDNMETVTDGRIMKFIQDLPLSFKGKVLLTSRKRSEGWEQAIKIEELSHDEVIKFIEVRSKELDLNGQLHKHSAKIMEITGGLPLAIQWTLGRYKIKRNLEEILDVAINSNSPLLEFSFGNLWQDLTNDSKQALAVLSVFDEPPSKQIWRMALDWPVEKIDTTISELQDVTLIREDVNDLTGSVTYHALPITLTFSRNKLSEMGSLERVVRSRYQEHVQSMQLVAQETDRYEHLFEVYDAHTENQKKALILCRMADSQEELGPDAAEQYYRQAYELEPRSIYVLVKYGRFLVDVLRIGEGLEHLREATKRCNKKTGFFAYYNLAMVYDQLYQRPECKKALEKALEYDSTHVHARHLYGVVLSRLGEREHSIKIFDELIQEELDRPGGPTNTLVYALKTKYISLKKLGYDKEAKDFLDYAVKLAQKYDRTRYMVRTLEEL